MNKVELLDDCNNSLGEGITYSSINNNLYWLDIGNISKLYKLELSSNKKEVFELPEIVTATSIKSNDELILATNNGLKLFNTSNKNFLMEGLDDIGLTLKDTDLIDIYEKDAENNLPWYSL